MLNVAYILTKGYGKESFLNSKLLNFDMGHPQMLDGPSIHLSSTYRKQMERWVGILGGVRADHGVEEVDFDIDYTTLCVGRGV